MSPELLEDVLVELRPVPDADWAQEMDQRVARGFRQEAPAQPRKQRWYRRTWAAPAFATATCAALIVGVVALNPPDGDDALSVEGRAIVEDVDTGAGGGSTAASGENELSAGIGPGRGRAAADSAVAPPVGSPTVPGQNRRVERMATLTLTAPPKDVPRVGDQVLRVTDRMGGYVASSSVSSSEEGGGGSYELKIPVGRLDDAMGELSELAHVAERSQSTQDITGAFRSARSRLREARTERESLLRQLAAADTVNETASIRRRLELVAGQIGNAKGELSQVRRRASYATVSVSLASDADAPAGGEDDDGVWTPADAIDDAGRILEVAAGVLVIVLAAALPIALLLALGALAGRAVVRRRREQALDATA